MRKNFRIHISRIGGVLSLGKKAEVKVPANRSLLLSIALMKLKENLFMLMPFLLLIFYMVQAFYLEII